MLTLQLGFPAKIIVRNAVIVKFNVDRFKAIWGGIHKNSYDNLRISLKVGAH